VLLSYSRWGDGKSTATPIFISAGESALAGIAAPVPVGSAPEAPPQSLRQFLGRRNLVRNRCLSNLCIGAHDALRQRTWSGEEGLGDLLGGQAAHLAQGERRRASGARDGWQQVKIRRRRSSSISSSSSFSPGGTSLMRASMWATRSFCAPSKRA